MKQFETFLVSDCFTFGVMIKKLFYFKYLELELDDFEKTKRDSKKEFEKINVFHFYGFFK